MMPDQNPNPYQSSNVLSSSFEDGPEWNEATQQHIGAMVRILQVISLALVGGVSVYLITLISQGPRQPVPGAQPLISLSAILMSGGALFFGLTFGLLIECADSRLVDKLKRLLAI